MLIPSCQLRVWYSVVSFESNLADKLLSFGFDLLHSSIIVYYFSLTTSLLSELFLIIFTTIRLVLPHRIEAMPRP